jgi:hypothetical protein
MPNMDSATDSQLRGFFPRALSVSEDQNVMTNPPTKPIGNIGMLPTLNQRKDTRKDIRKDISTQP